MNLNQLHAFRVLAETEHYTKAAEKLDVAQSSLSRTIASLEQDLGTYLFEKRGRGVALTREGRLFYEHVSRGLSEIDLGVRAVRESLDPTHGVIDFGFIYALSPTYIPRILSQFLAIPDYHEYTFRFYQGNSNKILPQIREGVTDLGLASYMEGFPDLEFIPLIRQEYVLVTGQTHPLATRQNVTLADAAGYDMIMPLDRTNYVENLFASQNLSPHITSRVEEDIAAAALVSIGMGLAILPRNTILSQYGVRQISFAPKPVYRDFYLVHRRDGSLPPAAENFFRFLRRNAERR